MLKFASRPAARPRMHRLGVESLERRELLVSYPVVVIETNLGSIPLEMYDDTAPQTVANFLKYVDDGDYENAIFHRVVQNFVVQGGGFRSSSDSICTCSIDEITPAQVDADLFSEVPTDPPVANEFQRSNIKGTVAMAKLGGDPNSATNQFFFNLADNSQNLDNQNGGFTVFAGLLNDRVVTEMATGKVINLSSLFPPSSRLSAIVSAPIFEGTASETVRIVRMTGFSGTAILSGTVFLDLNHDGVRNIKEGGIANAVVYIDADNDGQHDPNEPLTAANSLGQYEFEVGPGEHRIRAMSMDDYEATGGAAGEVRVVTATFGRRFTNHDFGFQYTGTSWFNSRLPSDVDGMNGTIPLDALLAVNELTLREFSDPQTGALPVRTTPLPAPRFLDVDNNQSFSPLDALLVINNLTPSDPNAPLSGGAIGESQRVSPQLSPYLPATSPLHDGGTEKRSRIIDRIFARE